MQTYCIYSGCIQKHLLKAWFHHPQVGRLVRRPPGSTDLAGPPPVPLRGARAAVPLPDGGKHPRGEHGALDAVGATKHWLMVLMGMAGGSHLQHSSTRSESS